MKFLHTADWQIGMKAAHAKAASARVRDERIAAARRAVDLAREHRAEFILLAGDTFEDNGIDRAIVQRIALTLADFPGPVYLLPGNHDPIGPTSVWEHPCWTAHDNLHVIARPEPIDLAGGRLYPCPVLEKHSTEDPTAWIEPGADQLIRIGMAHGSVEGVAQQSLELPIPRDAAVRHRLDYLALGHWHSTAVYDRMAYSGTHEPTRFDERDSGNVLVVEIDAPGEPPRLTPVRTGGLTWIVKDQEIRTEGDLAQVRREIESIDDPENTLLSVSLRGVLHAGEQENRRRIDETAQARGFLFHRIDAGHLLPAPHDDRWLAELPPGPLRETVRRLQQWADPEVLDGRPEYATPEVAARALLDFYAAWQGGQG